MDTPYLFNPRDSLGEYVNDLYGHGPIELPGHQAGVDLVLTLHPYRWYSMPQIEMAAGRLAMRYKRTRAAGWVALYQKAMAGYCAMLAMGAAR